jgi:hypothetical protein
MVEQERSRPTLTVVQAGESDLANGWIIRKDGQKVPVNFVASKVEYGGKTIIQVIFKEIPEFPKPKHIQVGSKKNQRFSS